LILYGIIGAKYVNVLIPFDQICNLKELC